MAHLLVLLAKEWICKRTKYCTGRNSTTSTLIKTTRKYAMCMVIQPAFQIEWVIKKKKGFNIFPTNIALAISFWVHFSSFIITPPAQKTKQIKTNNNPSSHSWHLLHSCISAGTTDGFRIYNCEPFAKAYEHRTQWPFPSFFAFALLLQRPPQSILNLPFLVLNLLPGRGWWAWDMRDALLHKLGSHSGIWRSAHFFAAQAAHTKYTYKQSKDHMRA